MRTLLIILLIFCFTKLTHGQYIEKSSVDSGGASAINGGIELLYTLGEVNAQERSSGNTVVSEGFVSPAFRIQIQAKFFLQGPRLSENDPGLMNDDLRIAGYLPTTSPYPDNLETVQGVFNATGNNAIVDWVFLELRDGNDNTKIISRKSGLLQRDGDVVSINGTSPMVMNAPQNNYYVIINHRNHIRAMSANPINLSETPVVVDFSDSAFTTYGINAQVMLPSGDMALWAGDVNEDGFARFSGSGNDTNIIKDFILADPANGFNSVTHSSTGFLNIDLNLDGIGRFSGSGNDSNIIKDNILAHPGNGFDSVTYIIEPTVPPGN